MLCNTNKKNSSVEYKMSNYYANTLKKLYYRHYDPMRGSVVVPQRKTSHY